MKRTISTFTIAAIVAIATAAWAQDKTVTIRETGVVATGGDISIQPDGGCLIVARGTNDAGYEVHGSQYSFNGARCTTMKSALLQCLKNDFGVGNGAAP